MSYLAKTKSKGHEYYSIMESYREDGKVKHRVLYRIGTLSDLYALLPDHIKGKKASKVSASSLQPNRNYPENNKQKFDGTLIENTETTA